MKQTTELLSLLHVQWRRASANGNPRWCFLARTTEGATRRIKTSTDNSRAFGYDISSMKVGTVMRVTYHETQQGNLIADSWDDSRTAGADLALEFDALATAAQISNTVADPQTPHQPARL